MGLARRKDLTRGLLGALGLLKAYRHSGFLGLICLGEFIFLGEGGIIAFDHSKKTADGLDQGDHLGSRISGSGFT